MFDDIIQFHYKLLCDYFTKLKFFIYYFQDLLPDRQRWLANIYLVVPSEIAALVHLSEPHDFNE